MKKVLFVLLTPIFITAFAQDLSDQITADNVDAIVPKITEENKMDIWDQAVKVGSVSIVNHLLDNSLVNQ